MSKPFRPLAEYTEFVKSQVFHTSPGQQLRDWISVWSRLFQSMQGVNAIFELSSLVIARWEFLGALYLGTEGDSDYHDALAYSRQFLIPINRNYACVENLVDCLDPRERFDLFTMLRNKPLHGLVAAGIATPDNKGVVTWWIGFHKIAPENHLTVDRNGGLHLDGSKFCEELLQSVASFADYQDANTDLVEGRLPHARWRRGYWARFKPKFMKCSLRMAEGVKFGV